MPIDSKANAFEKKNSMYNKFGTNGSNYKPPKASTSKGKGPDPKNWGNVRLTRDEKDPESQKVLLDSYKSVQIQNQNQNKNTKKRNNKRSNKRKCSALEQNDLIEKLYSTDMNDLKLSDDDGKALRPIKQVKPNSYIGVALKRLRGGCRELTDGTTSDEDGTTDESDESDDSSTSTLSTASSSDNLNKRKHAGGGKKSQEKKDRRKAKKKHQKMKLKPIPPIEYDGSEDPQMIHWFITEGTAYVKDGNVPSKKRVFILSHYLTGRAHEFYIREVSGDPYCWRLPKFFSEMFNYCFSVDFRGKQQQKLHKCRQNDRSVRDYLYDLNEYWNTIGETNERTKVTKFWFGLRRRIQQGLWLEKLNPEVSKLRNIVNAAEIIEIAQSVMNEIGPTDSK